MNNKKIRAFSLLKLVFNKIQKIEAQKSVFKVKRQVKMVSREEKSFEVEKDQYATENLAENYRLFLKSRESELQHIQIPSIRKMLGGSLKGKRVVDMACGNGGSTRILADLDPDELIGVDLSSEQVRLAEKISASEPKYANIKYLVRDCSQPIGLGQFDLVFSKHLLNYGTTVDVLKGIVNTMFDATKPGRFSN